MTKGATNPRRAPLSPAEERKLVIACQSNHEQRERLIEAFMPLIARVARLYRGAVGVEREELLQEGVVGLLRALERFDPDQGTPFWAYASWWVRQAMQQLVSELGRPVVLSDRAMRQLARIRDARSERLRTDGRPLTAAELAEATGMSVEHVECLLAAERRARGLEEPLRAEDGATTLGELVADPRAEDAYEAVPTRIVAGRLPAMLSTLSDRERAVVRDRFGLGGPERTLREIGTTLGVSAERVRQIEESTLRKLNAAATAESPWPQTSATA